MPLAKMRSIGAVARLGGAGLLQLGAGCGRTRIALEVVVALAHALQAEDLAEDHRPTGQRHDQQPGHHELHHEAGMQHEREDREVLVHVRCCSRTRRECGSGLKRRGASTQAMRMSPSASSSVPRQACCCRCMRRAAGIGARATVTSSRSSSRAGAQVAHGGLGDDEHRAVVAQHAAARSPARAAIRCARARRTSGSWRRTPCRRRRCLPSTRAAGGGRRRAAVAAQHGAADDARRRSVPARRRRYCATPVHRAPQRMAGFGAGQRESRRRPRALRGMRPRNRPGGCWCSR